MRTTEKIMVLDIETANTTEDGLAYDIGFIVADRHGNIFEKHSYCVYDIFVLEKELMKSAYYGWKIPQYEELLAKKEMQLKTIFSVKKIIAEIMKEYNIKKVFAYNCYFDKTMLNKTLRYITKSQYRWFFPYGTEFCDIWNFACSTICQKKSYKEFCESNNYISNRGRNYQAKAETVYQFIKKDNQFQEEHKGLADVLIEYAILLECYKTHKKVITDIDRLCWRKVARV